MGRGIILGKSPRQQKRCRLTERFLRDKIKKDNQGTSTFTKRHANFQRAKTVRFSNALVDEPVKILWEQENGGVLAAGGLLILLFLPNITRKQIPRSKN